MQYVDLWLYGHHFLMREAGARRSLELLLMPGMSNTNPSLGCYHVVLKEADIVSVCYDQKKYHARGLGLALEAIAFGNIVAKHMSRTGDGTAWATVVTRHISRKSPAVTENKAEMQTDTAGISDRHVTNCINCIEHDTKA